MFHFPEHQSTGIYPVESLVFGVGSGLIGDLDKRFYKRIFSFMFNAIGGDFLFCYSHSISVLSDKRLNRWFLYD